MQIPCVWFCSFSGAGKTTIAHLLRQRLVETDTQPLCWMATACEQGCARISDDRLLARNLFPEKHFLRAFADMLLDECAPREPKGPYAKARQGVICLHKGGQSPEEAAHTILQAEALWGRRAAPCR